MKIKSWDKQLRDHREKTIEIFKVNAMLKSLYFIFENIKKDVRNYNELKIFLFLGYKD